MENKEAKNVTMNVTGTVLTDGMVNSIERQTEKTLKFAEKNGEKEGVITTLRNEINHLQEELERTNNTVTVIVKSHTDEGKVITRRPWEDDYTWFNNTSSDHTRSLKDYTRNAQILKVETLPTMQLNKLADNAVIDEANQLIELAQKDITKAEAKAKVLEEKLERTNKAIESEREEKAKDIENAVRRHERKNLETINDLKSEVIVLESQVLNNANELKLIKVERDVAIENMALHIDMLNKEIELLKMKSPFVVSKLINNIKNYWYFRRLKSNL